MKKLLVLVTLFGVLVFATSASANRNHAATVVVSPSPAHVGDSLTFSGCGYTVGEAVTVVVISPQATSFSGANADGNGCFSTAGTWGYTAQQAGNYEVDTYTSNGHHADATLAFTVS